MRFRPCIARCVAFFLLLVFAQKSGAGLYLHNLLHTNAKSRQTESSSPTNDKANEISYACSCVDDLLMPFMEAAQPVSSPIAIQYETPTAYFLDVICFHPVIYSSLRGPPAVVL